MLDAEEPGLVRYWFEFDLSGLRSRPPEPGRARVDGGTRAEQLLALGVGVTGYNEADCLNLVRLWFQEELPSVSKSVRNPTIDDGLALAVGNPAWRGIWKPHLNISGPIIG